MAQRDLSEERRRRLRKRLLPVAGALLFLILVFAIVLGSGASDEVTGARRFVGAWERGDFAAMHAQLTDEAKRRYPRAVLERAYRSAAATATAASVSAGDPHDAGGGAAVEVKFRTRVFGSMRGELDIPMSGTGVDWSPRLVFPALRAGEVLTRRSDPPRRAGILARDGSTIVSGPATARTASAAGSAIAGAIGAVDTAPGREAIYARGFPHDWPVGLGGLEGILESRVAGRPGGKLLAGPRVVASAASRAARPVHTTIDMKLEAAAQTALAGRFGGIAVLDAHTAQVRALSGIAFSAPQPPGSTFKIVTLAAALEHRVAKTTTRFPFGSYALIDGVKLQNANGEVCGGTVAEAFVESCNSVYAPLGVRVGSKRLVEMAERFGWNRPPPFRGARPSTLPQAGGIESKLALGSTAIGQGKVLATPLELATVAQTIAAGGLQRTPTIVPGPLPRARRVISTRIAHTIRKLMVGVVARGTGTSAAIGSGVVAGKTGTAELESTTGPTAATSDGRSHTDAWFTSFAPASHPRVVVAVMLVRAGAGGQTAAPAARVVLQAALSR